MFCLAKLFTSIPSMIVISPLNTRSTTSSKNNSLNLNWLSLACVVIAQDPSSWEFWTLTMWKRTQFHPQSPHFWSAAKTLALTSLWWSFSKLCDLWNVGHFSIMHCAHAQKQGCPEAAFLVLTKEKRALGQDCVLFNCVSMKGLQLLPMPFSNQQPPDLNLLT